jgi:hypothetical protein
MMGRWLGAIAGVCVLGWVSPPQAAASSQDVASVPAHGLTASGDSKGGCPPGTKCGRHKAVVKIYRGTVDGKCSKHRIHKRLRQRNLALRTCYHRALKKNPKLSGMLRVQWTIGNRGRVEGPVRAKGMGSVGKCVASKLKRFRFRPPEKGLCDIQWSFVFTRTN